MEFVDIFTYWKVNEKLKETLSLDFAQAAHLLAKSSAKSSQEWQLKIWCYAGWDSNLDTICLKQIPWLLGFNMELQVRIASNIVNSFIDDATPNKAQVRLLPYWSGQILPYCSVP